MLEDEEPRSSICSSMCCSFSKLIELMYVTGKYLCSMLERCRLHEERSEDENFCVKLSENRGQFIGRCFGTKHSDQKPVPKHSDKIPVLGYSDQLLEVRVLQDEDVGPLALGNWERDETSFDGFAGANDSVSAMLTQIDRSKEQFVSINFQKLVITLCKEKGGIVLTNARKKYEFVKTSECASEKLREWCCNRDSHTMSIHHTRFAV